MKLLIILLVFIAAIQLPHLAGAQDQKVPVKTSDGAIRSPKQESVPVKPGEPARAAVARTFMATQAPQGGNPVSTLQPDKNQAVANTGNPGKTPGTISSLPVEQLIKPVNKDFQPPKIEQQGPAPAPVNTKPQPAKP
ncbi:hypothetical protein [Chitinophaga qingshengii]|uniref:Uncharacterized protein n=1 Tax=Chitinophaga qingshengii TaxID=1569794 RepID=A0ABR7TZB6_9BACT|nr:hypothetical protein [Chitinophaga qingshengii]MBC9934674.1 hypothetical protein [Chitinophaga qingshengii]